MYELKEPIIKSLLELQKQKLTIIGDIMRKRNKNIKKMKIMYKQDILKDQVNINLADFQEKLESSVLAFRNTPKPKQSFANYEIKCSEIPNTQSRLASCVKKSCENFTNNEAYKNFIDDNNRIDIKYGSLICSINEKEKNNEIEKDCVKDVDFEEENQFKNVLIKKNISAYIKNRLNNFNSIATEDTNSSKDNNKITVTNPITNNTVQSSYKSKESKPKLNSRFSNNLSNVSEVFNPSISKNRRKSPNDNSTLKTNKSTYRQITFTLDSNSADTEENTKLIPYESYNTKHQNLVSIQMRNKFNKSKLRQKELLVRNVNRGDAKFPLCKTISNWKNIKKIKGNYYNSGKFNIPLFTKD